MKNKKIDNTNALVLKIDPIVSSNEDVNNVISYDFDNISNLEVDDVSVSSVIGAYNNNDSQEVNHVSLLSTTEDFSNNNTMYVYNNIAEDVNFVVDHSFVAFGEIQEFEDTSSAITINEENNEFGNLIYEETRGGDFLESAVEETLPYFLEKNEGGNDVYKILKNSLDDTNNVEIWDYNNNNSKIDIADFVEEYGDSLDYSVCQEEGDVTLQINHQDQSKGSVDIVFKDADFGSGDLDNIIKNLILTNGSKD